jgi:hypothetical protein
LSQNGKYDNLEVEVQNVWDEYQNFFADNAFISRHVSEDLEYDYVEITTVP